MNRKKFCKPAQVKVSVDELVARLGEPLNDKDGKTLWTYNEQTGLHSINIVHRYDRLNRVLGVNGWRKTERIKSIELTDEFDRVTGARLWEATAEVFMEFPALGGITREGRGGYRNTDRGDAEKGAVSDAAGNALKDLVGKEAYLGLLDIPKDESAGKPFRPEKDGPPLKKTGREEFTSASGVVTQMLDSSSGAWLQVDGWTCYAKNGMSERLAGLGCAVGKRVECNARWEMSKDEKWYKAITGVIGVSDLPPMEIPKI